MTDDTHTAGAGILGGLVDAEAETILSHLVAACRTYDPKLLERQYRAGVLTMGYKVEGLPERRVDLCPLCDCAKSGDAEIENSHSEWCKDDACPCHTEPLG